MQSFITHIEQTVARKPQVLIAYAWVMYMALFNGGRWLRAQLLAAGDAFWVPPDHESEKVYPVEKVGLGFFHFNGTRDGEDLKKEFKMRLVEVEKLLSASERDDIVSEAVHIFRRCRLVVEELDELMVASATDSAQISVSPPILPVRQLLLKHTLPLGMAELGALLIAFLSGVLLACPLFNQKSHVNPCCEKNVS